MKKYRTTHWMQAVLWGAMVLVTCVLHAQSPVERASRLAQSGSWWEAYDVLAPVIQSEPQRSDARAWFMLGFIEKELHKSSGESGAEAPHRVQSVESFEQALSMPALPTKDRETAREALDFLSRTYFREAIDRVEGFTPGSTAEILGLMSQYERIQTTLNPQFDKSDQRADLHRYLGQAHAQLLETERHAGTAMERELFEGAVEHYGKSLAFDPDNYASQYNLAIVLYNHGVRQLKRIDHNTSMFELMEIQDQCVALFESALQPMQQSYTQRPERLETLKGLMTIHYALSQKEESDMYRSKIEDVLQKR